MEEQREMVSVIEGALEGKGISERVEFNRGKIDVSDGGMGESEMRAIDGGAEKSQLYQD